MKDNILKIKSLVVVFVGFLAHSFATIANFQWFSKLPSPLNGMVEGNHWDQWFSDGFGVRQPLVTMVFDGCAPLVRRWNGYVPSSKSSVLFVTIRVLKSQNVFFVSHCSTIQISFKSRTSRWHLIYYKLEIIMPSKIS